MNFYSRIVLLSLVLLLPEWCFSKDTVNLVFLPDVFNCHQLGIETVLSGKNTLGAIGRSGCHSNRPTYGSANDSVTNSFSRILVPWRYSPNGGFEDGYFLQALVGLEKSRFASQLGSTAEVSFLDVGFHVGYQWFWGNGFNVSVLGGAAFLNKRNSTVAIGQNEEKDVVEFLDKNTKTNVHGGGGIIVGWSF